MTPDRRLNEQLRKLDPALRRAFLDAIKKARRSVDIEALIAALERQDIERAVDLLRIRDQVMYPLAEAVRDAFIAGGLVAGGKLPVTVRAVFGFGSNPRADAKARELSGRLIEGIQADTMEMTRRVISQGVNEGIPVAKLARQITGEGRARVGGFLGLDSRTAESVMSGRAKLLSGDPAQMREYMRLELRNKQFDPAIRRAIRDGKKLATADVDRIIAAHRSKALGHRGRVIARTETLQALRAGQHEGFEQVAQIVGADRIEVTWKVTRDGREREAHGLLGGTKVGFGENFISPATGAPMAYPGDDSQGARGVDVIQCRCAAIYRVKPRRQA